ncbi:MAG: ADP-ribosylglycohydrolase family protein, partial [Clostridia bacterium]|nr:ADP-ribosylglycohydrolase family protein [Clostridia bacterium]
AIIAFLESEDYESAIRNAISLGGDADTEACIAGGIAEAYYGEIPKHISDFCDKRIDFSLKVTVREFEKSFVKMPSKRT